MPGCCCSSWSLLARCSLSRTRAESACRILRARTCATNASNHHACYTYNRHAVPFMRLLASMRVSAVSFTIRSILQIYGGCIGVPFEDLVSESSRCVRFSRLWRVHGVGALHTRWRYSAAHRCPQGLCAHRQARLHGTQNTACSVSHRVGPVAGPWSRPRRAIYVYIIVYI